MSARDTRPSRRRTARVPVRPFLRDVVRRVSGAEGEVQVEGLVGVDLVRVRDELDRLVDEVFREVIPLFRCPGRLDLVVVIDEVRIPLARVTAEEAVEALEAAGYGPARVRPRRRFLVARRQMPLAHGVRVVASPRKDLRQHPVLERHDAVVAGIPGRQFRDGGHAVSVVVAAGDDARAAGRTERGRVHVVEAQAGRGDPVEVRRRDRAAEAPEVPEPSVIQHDEHYVRGALCRPGGSARPGRAGLIDGPPDHAGKGRAGRVLDDRHVLHLDPICARPRSAMSIRFDQRKHSHRRRGVMSSLRGNARQTAS